MMKKVDYISEVYFSADSLPARDYQQLLERTIFKLGHHTHYNKGDTIHIYKVLVHAVAKALH